ncbi:MAG: hypothetical protein U9M95_00065 [Candidatus Altiarchaeota archaeon]|nr:hypothetical protein [Candidatus Altiarchaeota archaeon]
MRKIMLFLLVAYIALLGFEGSVRAEILFYYDAEDGIVGQELPHHQSSGIEFCQPECSSSNDARGRIIAGSTPQGNNLMEWYIKSVHGTHTGESGTVLQDPSASWNTNEWVGRRLRDLTTDTTGNILSNTATTVTTSIVWNNGDKYQMNEGAIYCEIKNKTSGPINLVDKQSYYLAYFMKFNRTSSQLIFEDYQGEKGLEINGDGLRWEISKGRNPVYEDGLEDGEFTVYAGNANYHFNSEEINDVFPQNRKGYNMSNPYIMTQGKWYGLVMQVQMSAEYDATMAIWVNGVQIMEYDGLRTTNDNTATLERLTLDGTIAQPRYATGPHYRRYDAFMFTDSWQDIVDGGYLRDPETTDLTPPSRSNPQPNGTLDAGTTSANISLTTNINATCRYSNTSNTNYTEMESNFTYANSTNHSTPVTDLENGLTYTFYVRCNSSGGYVNDEDFNISFSVDGHKADLNDDGVINMPELISFIARWKACDGVTKQEVEEVRDIWFGGGDYQ